MTAHVSLLGDTREVLRYVRAKAQAGAEQAEALREVASAVLQTTGEHALRPDMLRQFALAVQAQTRYLGMLYSSVLTEEERRDA